MADTDRPTRPLPQGGGDPAAGGGQDLGDVPQDPDLEAQGQITDAEYQKDTKTAEI